MKMILGAMSGLLAVSSTIVLFWIFAIVSIFIFDLIMFLLEKRFSQKWHNRLHNIVSLVFFVLAILIMSIPPLLLLGIAVFSAFIFIFPDRWLDAADSFLYKPRVYIIKTVIKNDHSQDSLKIQR